MPVPLPPLPPVVMEAARPITDKQAAFLTRLLGQEGYRAWLEQFDRLGRRPNIAEASRAIDIAKARSPYWRNRGTWAWKYRPKDSPKPEAEANPELEAKPEPDLRAEIEALKAGLARLEALLNE
jgi:hypothetical protein